MNYPLIHEITYQDPMALFSHFAQESGAVFLDSAQLRENCGRYSFIAIDPFQTLVSRKGVVQLRGNEFAGNPFDILTEELAKYPLDFYVDMPPFQGGVAGYFSYDLCHHLEKIPDANTDDMQCADMVLGFYDLLMSFDHELKRAWIFASGYPAIDRAQHAHERCQWLLERLHYFNSARDCARSVASEDFSTAVCANEQIESNFTSLTYQAAVNKVINYILAGDIFEANISQCFRAKLPGDLTAFELYRRLRLLNPAPFAAYLNVDGLVLASASPERFLKLENKNVEARPIKGTRARGKTPLEDKQLSDELSASEKDRAENIMIVDLLRNDLSRVCQDHSVKVPQLCGLESYASVHHLVSVVTGKLKEAHDAVDLLRASFPGGSITGAPKIRAMEIIAEIEPNRRGPYCGCIAYIGFNGDMDSSITIRTYAIKNGVVRFQAGGAIVADSDPLAEYEETLIKAKALRNALMTVPRL